MASKTLAHGGVVITIEDESVDAVSEAVGGLSSTPDFHLIKAVANVFIFEKGKDHKKKEHQLAQFTKDITLTVPIPEDVNTDDEVKKRGRGVLKLAYLDKKDRWRIFPNQHINEEQTSISVRFKTWIKDPPVGIGRT